ncbi:MAG: tetratricopeptide repeat protein [Microcoleus sp. PH2017_10_PVI_O_A]|uniref:tetratricopeptide repeat protein n=1 Tax=Microcoleus sp. PH2017_10_PVI_O_A TaxID=2798821 RepID=UPI001D5044AB|nr:tetratricopeptide repeat protein [Microcoleus sp. PH2017_10_PVI_O_A]MCC3404604.1 tetratricopeptide repeat protein [Microcoleus sp. PH2017_10_PVI_O_A]MCC3558063.1 tetratricopeptide repeat protein [Microcoleus sp. PH2017_27_LUM_O_A]
MSNIALRELPLKGLEREAAVNLLESYQRCLNLTASSEELAQLAERYQGHPKALEIVATLIKDDRKFNGNVCKFLGDRQWLLINTLDRLIDEVFIRVSALERTCLTRISVYQTSEYPLNTAGIAAQMPEVSDYELEESIIQGLRRRQLLDYDDNMESYQMHPLIQEKAYRLLRPHPKNVTPESRLANRQAYGYFLSIPLKPHTEWQETEDIKPLFRAHYHACCAEDWDEGAGAIFGCYNFLRLGFYFQFLKALYIKLIPTDWKNGKQLVTSSEIHADILLCLGVACIYLGEYQIANEYLSHSLSVSRQIGYCKGEASSLCSLGDLYLETTNCQVSLEYLKQSLLVARKIENRFIECQVMIYEGANQYYLGNIYLAIEIYQKALQIARQINCREKQVSCLKDLGLFYNDLGDYTSAFNYINEYLSIPDCYKGTRSQEELQIYLANIYFNKGEESTAKTIAKKALEIEAKLGKKSGTDAFISLGINYNFFETYQESIKYFHKRLERSQKIGTRFDEAWALYQLGIIHQKLGNPNSSLEYFYKSFSIFQEIGTRAYEAKALLALAQISHIINTIPQETIQDYCDRAEQICIELNLPLLAEVQKFKTNPASIDNEHS